MNNIDYRWINQPTYHTELKLKSKAILFYKLLKNIETNR